MITISIQLSGGKKQGVKEKHSMYSRLPKNYKNQPYVLLAMTKFSRN
jgi:hypothetical protein